LRLDQRLAGKDVRKAGAGPRWTAETVTVGRTVQAALPEVPVE